MPELVPRTHLQPAIALNSMGINISRAIGPALAGFLITAIGLSAPFFVNAASHVFIIVALLLWKQPARQASILPPEPIGAAMLTGVLVPRVQVLRIPLVVGEILIGIVLGASGFHIIPDEPDPWLELLSQFGFAFLMFLSGLEIDVKGLSVGPAGDDGGDTGSKGGLRSLPIVTFSIFAATLMEMRCPDRDSTRAGNLRQALAT